MNTIKARRRHTGLKEGDFLLGANTVLLVLFLHGSYGLILGRVTDRSIREQTWSFQHCKSLNPNGIQASTFVCDGMHSVLGHSSAYVQQQ